MKQKLEYKLIPLDHDDEIYICTLDESNFPLAATSTLEGYEFIFPEGKRDVVFGHGKTQYQAKIDFLKKSKKTVTFDTNQLYEMFNNMRDAGIKLNNSSVGSSLDSFLEEEELLEHCQAVAKQRTDDLFSDNKKRILELEEILKNK